MSSNGSTQNSFSSRGGNVPSVINARLPTILVTTATPTSVTTNQCASTFVLPSVGANIFLPTPVNAGPGWNCKFTNSATNATTAWTISPTGTVFGSQTNIYGQLNVPPAGATLYNNSTGTCLTRYVSGTGSLNFGITSQKGDFVSFVSDGTNYIIQGFGATGSSFT